MRIEWRVKIMPDIGSDVAARELGDRIEFEPRIMLGDAAARAVVRLVGRQFSDTLARELGALS